MGWIGDEIKDVLDSLHDGTLMEGLGHAVAVTITRVVKGEYDTPTGKRAESDPVRSVANALVSDYGLSEIAQSGGLIIQGDMKFIILASEAGTIDQHTTFTYGGAIYRPISTKPRLIDGAVYDYEIQGRR